MNCQHRSFAPDGSQSRRWFLRECGLGLGKIGLASLIGNNFAQAAAPSLSHLPGKAKAVIHLFMAGAPSQLDLFDPKPALEKLDGKPLPPSVIGNQRLAFIRPDAGVMASRFKFAQHGQSGAWISELLPHTAQIADDLCFIRSVKTDQFNHAPAQIFFNTGFLQPGRPSIGSWVTYGLGSMNNDLPSFVVLSTGAGISGGAANWSSGFIPTVHAGVRFRNSGDPILNTASPKGVDQKLQRETINLIGDLNCLQLDTVGDPEIATRIASHEMAFRLQQSAPELTDLSGEPESILKLYGITDINQPSYARACLLARRMIERGVRYINIYNEGWDAHSDLAGNHGKLCKATDQASAALVTDLKQRGLLDETLVVWGGEFGRTPMVETNPSLGRALGRDHHPSAFTIWMAGGGIQGGQSYGETDELGYHIVDKPVHVHDVQATILHCLGLDHERLTYLHAGRHFRLTDVHGHVVKALLA
ncbi:DUF1501 domain-containing protein [Phragmitibacter flavus]|uniref:DUF1501 domain-containing protein n=1 Tax=Phragmitibacter flavus TaxID=2576071 RepID=A0A5R8KBT0_9BACT|nr:DUF1501 domain-containing protein [Phragmitibacter flavus]TLD69770.1 DUF1501 domain-containing protein [Phragmitibacter flavus]